MKQIEEIVLYFRLDTGIKLSKLIKYKSGTGAYVFVIRLISKVMPMNCLKLIDKYSTDLFLSLLIIVTISQCSFHDDDKDI